MAEHTFTALLFAVWGLAWVALGVRCATGRLRRNTFAGVRLAGPMRSDAAWSAAHRAAARPFLAGGAVALAGAGGALVTGGRPGPLLAVGVAVAAGLVVSTVLAALRADRAAARVNRR